jgi:hypothetical protein
MYFVLVIELGIGDSVQVNPISGFKECKYGGRGWKKRE